jgi:hypothetical protein
MMADRTFAPPAPAAAPPKRGAQKVYQSRQYTPDQQAELLKHYIHLARGDWDSIRPSDSVRYVTTDGQFRVGGTVCVPKWTNPKADKTRSLMSLRSGLGKNVMTWTVPWDTIQEMYVAVPPPVIVMQRGAEANIRTLDQNVRQLVTTLQKLQTDVGTLRADVESLKLQNS